MKINFTQPFKIFLIFILPIAFVLPQKGSERRIHNFSGTVVASANGIFTLGQSDYIKSKLGFGAVGLAEYFIPSYSPSIFGIRLTFGGQMIRGTDNFRKPEEFSTDTYVFGGGLTFGYTFDNEFFPYVYAGVSNLWFSPKDINGKRLPNNALDAYSRSAISYDAEIGSRIILEDFLSMFFGAGVHSIQSDNIDDITLGNSNDYNYSINLGVSVSFFGKKDSDDDGIMDSEDACAFDAEDFDGFLDDDGCPDIDNDNDGILDEKDTCPDTKEDFDGFLDDDGCPDLDNDADGITDSKDGCPDIAENVNGFQDDDGCPDILDNTQSTLDRDGDGIANHLDKCPNEPETFNGFEDDDGCPDTIAANDSVKSQEIVLEGFKLFERGTTELKPTGFPDIDKVAEFLSTDPFIKWRVEGHTDNNGDPDSLQILSLQRASTVVRYLINKGLPSFMFKISGRGSEVPIADNNSLEGRLKNDRVVFKKLE